MATDMTTESILKELTELRRQVAGFESANSERSHAEDALRESHEELRAIYEGTVDGLLVADIETKHFVRCNAAMLRMTGYSEEELLSMSVMELHPPADLPYILERFQAQAEGRLGVNEQCPVLRKDGTVFHADISVGRITYRGRPCMIGFFRDITQRRAAEEALRQSHEELQAIYDGTPDGLVINDIETTQRVRSNRKMCEMLGYSEDEMPIHPSRVFPPEQAANIAEKFHAQVEGRLPLAENIPFVRKDGSVLYADITGNRIQYHGRPCLLSFVRDVTERKQTQETLRQSLAHLQMIYDAMVEGLLITDVATKRFVRVNSSLCRMLGYTEEELRRASIQDIHPHEEVPNDLQRFQAAADGRVTINEDRPVLRKDGSIFYADITGHPIDFDGRRCLLALFRDVTERRQSYEALKREQRTLRHMLRASDHERQLIAYEIHDGLAQQLAAARMQFQSYEHLSKQHSEKAKTAYEAGVEMLRQAHAEARRLISGVRPPILDESGITAAIAHLVHDQRKESRPQIEFQSRVSFDRLPKVLENAIYRIAQEALTNACRHSQSEKVRVSLVQEDGEVCLEVQDWGIGFDPEVVAGDRFGLEGIRERVRLLGGSTRIESAPGRGTLVVVVLPLMGEDGEED